MSRISNERTNNDYDYARSNKTLMKDSWLHSLLDPFNAPVCRIPSDIPYNSHLLQDRETFQLTVGPLGDFVGYFSPTAYLSHTIADWIFLSRSVSTLDYTTAGYFNHYNSATPSNYSMRISAPLSLSYQSFFKQGRLVSAGISFRYIGRADQHSGFIAAGSTVLSDAPSGQICLMNGDINELMYVQRVAPADGLRCVWIPVDEEAKNFKTLGGYNTASNLTYYFHGVGLPPGTILDVEVVRNYEYIPQPDYVELFKGSNDIKSTVASSTSGTNLATVKEAVVNFDKSMSKAKSGWGDFAMTTLKDFEVGGMAKSILNFATSLI